MITIYHVPHSRSMRVVWLMEELGEDYRIEKVVFPTPESYRAVSPLGTVPAIEDANDGPPIRMFESLAILQYITGRRLPEAMEFTVGPNPDPAAYAEHLQFLHFGEADLAGIMTSIFRSQLAARREGRDDAIPQHRLDNLAVRLAFLESHFADGRTWITGERFTIADISVGYALAFAAFLKLDRMFGAHVAGYWARLQARPAFQRTMAK